MSVITALIGTAVGLPLGLFLAALVSNALKDEGIGFQIPWAQLVAVIAGVLAAIVPARRAAKLNVLRALQYESGLRTAWQRLEAADERLADPLSVALGNRL